ncbi:MAG TPA: lysophospholipid acyltransferase family protein [Parvibaculum sp.]|uniref:lysophospholipid acyltransferase family protein n=1 Tax=Parvibaculum sp. TaxID=2024848 RepID=UPI002CDE53DA|nr:lysophospholipid acyltransferase family protein [Parvibaculum sp.]HMM13310.1 lysophospholipid acyltransferase family protein [Parvibaculum sp.]
MSLGKRILKSETVQTTIAFVAAMLIKLVRRTSRFEVRRGDIAARFWTGDEPFIGATWHGQNLILPTFWHNWREMRILVSRHGDGEIVSKIMHFLGVGTIRGSGVPKGEERREKFKGKGGAGALRAMVRALGENISVGMTADLPPGPARRAGDGIVMLARLSGCPIVPVAATTRARVQLNNWDKFTINLPFSKGALVWGEPIYVARDADPETLEDARRRVEEGLNAVTAEADQIVGRAPRRAANGAAVH